MSNLSDQQIKSIMKQYDLTEEEVLRYEKNITETFSFKWQTIVETVTELWETIKPFFIEEQQRIQTRKFFRKKKTQQKNWKKWKKRK